MNKKSLVVVLVAALLMYGGAFVAGGSLLGKTETKVETVTVTETKEVEVVKQVTPESCVRALTAADRLRADQSTLLNMYYDLSKAIVDSRLTADFVNRQGDSLDRLLKNANDYMPTFSSEGKNCMLSRVTS